MLEDMSASGKSDYLAVSMAHRLHQPSRPLPDTQRRATQRTRAQLAGPGPEPTAPSKHPNWEPDTGLARLPISGQRIADSGGTSRSADLLPSIQMRVVPPAMRPARPAHVSTPHRRHHPSQARKTRETSSRFGEEEIQGQRAESSVGVCNKQPKNLVHHSGCGSQYTSILLLRCLAATYASAGISSGAFSGGSANALR
jgi:hypothetical protein